MTWEELWDFLSEDEADELPPTEESSLGIGDEGTEHDQTVAAHQSQSLIDQLHQVGRWQVVGTIVANIKHHQALLEDEELDLEVAPIGPEDDDAGIGHSTKHEKHWVEECDA